MNTLTAKDDYLGLWFYVRLPPKWPLAAGVVHLTPRECFLHGSTERIRTGGSFERLFSGLQHDAPVDLFSVTCSLGLLLARARNAAAPRV